jgi:hypothetical protein
LLSTFRRRTASFNWIDEGSELDEASIRDFLATTYPRLVAGLAEVLESRDHRFILNENPRRNSERRMAVVERTMAAG